MNAEHIAQHIHITIYIDGTVENWLIHEMHENKWCIELETRGYLKPNVLEIVSDCATGNEQFWLELIHIVGAVLWILANISSSLCIFG